MYSEILANPPYYRSAPSRLLYVCGRILAGYLKETRYSCSTNEASLEYGHISKRIADC